MIQQPICTTAIGSSAVDFAKDTLELLLIGPENVWREGQVDVAGKPAARDSRD